MKRLLHFLLLTASLFLISHESIMAQNDVLQNQATFGDFMDRSGNEYRTASGKPGPKYWQNEADYEIEVQLDTTSHTLSGKVTITYLNNSPESLEFIWLHMEQNRFTPDSRGTLTTPIQGNRYSGNLDGGYDIKNVTAKSGRNTTSHEYIVEDTRMQVFFDEPISPYGGSGTVSMDFSYKIPESGMDRMGRLNVEDGTIYALAQWYPKVAVFDDIRGWNILPYLGAGEFYLEYGDFDYKVTVPYDHIVVGSGELVNRKEVLSKTLLDRWDEASKSEETVFLINEDEVKNYSLTRPKNSGTITWHFHMKQSRDIAFATSNAFIWDAARMNLVNGESGLAQSAYPRESAGQEAWGRSTEYTKAAIEFFDKTYYPYPYGTAINVACNVNGMEYPAVSFCNYKARGSRLWGVTNHEFGHNWFPMIVGSNERRYAWMDEGFNTFINHYSTQAFNNGEYPATLDQTRRFVSWMTNDSREPIATYPDVTNLRNLGMTAYRKPGAGLVLLREYIIGPDRFDRAFRAYIERWAYKHPQPADFFNTIENVTGEDLNWFWKGWFYETGNIDLSITAAQRVRDGYLLRLQNNGEIPMPVLMKITYDDQTSENVKLPVEIWQRGNDWTHLHRTDKKIDSIIIDPERLLPDINGSNDVWPADYYEK
ncbi:M1 family metallopeptidase [Membranicola marinus]|uniref:M1 family metallopeptidase n=1 Tax=Membranihabitans marinus TaxID=1227546 RepID=A0A953LCH8_9BACT|nr:M1 family metallopeptidase [Membranihabitans marinus]MBY5957794.1 M1 family metallopeptidase [Membranihabitans marinus]